MQGPAKTIVFLTLLVASIASEGFSAQGTGRASSSSALPPSRHTEIDQLARQSQQALSHDHAEGAIRGYEKLVKIAPGVAEYHSNLGIAYFSSGRPYDAVQAFRQALKLKPGLAQAQHYLGASLAESGQCQEALPYLIKDTPRITDPQLKRTVEADGLRCTMALDQENDALDFLRRLKRDFPSDPEVLYLSVHVYSDLSTRASQKLLVTAPASYQVHELNAEMLELQEKWDEAAEEYRNVLAKNPNLPGIHYRLGRLLLTKPRTATSVEEARREFEGELKINPGNPGAEYVLGELARQARQWPEAIEHFSRAARLDPTFADAFIGLGKSLVSAGRASEAVAPLEAAVKLQPENPVAHYQLAFAYRRAGRPQDAEKELLAYRQANDKARQTTQDIRAGILGRMAPAQTADPPE